MGGRRLVLYTRARLQGQADNDNDNDIEDTMNRLLAKSLLCAAIVAGSGSSFATPAEWDGLTIQRIRAVGDYAGSDTTFDNTVEVWIASPPALPAGLGCTVNMRVYLNANNKHLVAAAYLALSMGKKIDVMLDDTLPIRASACEASFIDVLN